MLTILRYEGFYGTDEFNDDQRANSMSVTGTGTIGEFEKWNKEFRMRNIMKNKNAYGDEGVWSIKSEYQEMASAERYNQSYTPTHESRVLPWQLFNTGFLGVDHKMTPELTQICDKNAKEQVDFRPYINENPVTVFTTDSMLKCCEFFRKMHLRFLLVLEPTDGSLAGVICRQDLFKWLDL